MNQEQNKISCPKCGVEKIKGSVLIKLKNKEVTEIKELTDYNLGNRNRGRPNGWRT